ncbi:DnaD domain protein [Streptococcus catagoni]|uniref:DnaD domain protein n=1 Tax=Streptococcus catagoni TaxID=2654874 RepID=UPI00140E2602|nr:DnaD domain protein [Streptococcus catagoni]
MMKPIDEFYYVKHNKVLYDADSLIQLYFPIIGQDALALYQYLISFADQGSRSHKFSEILNHLQFGMKSLEEAFVILTAIDLLELFQTPDSYLIQIRPALTGQTFLANPVYRRLLEQKIGDLALSAMEIKIPSQARNISKQFSDVFGMKIEVQKRPEDSLHFDLDSFQNLMNRDGLQFENEQEDVISLYNLMERFSMNWYDLYLLAKETAVNYKIVPGRILAKKQAGASPKDGKEDFTKDELIIIREAKVTSALGFLEKVKKTRRATITKDEKELLVSLAKMNFLDEVINVMVLYTFNKTQSANLQKNYLLKIANDFSYQKINKAEDAVLKMRSFTEGKGYEKTKKSSKKSNVPAWSNPDYKENTSSEEQAELDNFKKEALKRLNNLKKGGG